MTLPIKTSLTKSMFMNVNYVCPIFLCLCLCSKASISASISASYPAELPGEKVRQIELVQLTRHFGDFTMASGHSSMCFTLALASGAYWLYLANPTLAWIAAWLLV